MDVCGDLQALDLGDLSALLNKGDAFFEGNPFIGRTLQTHPNLRDVRRLSVFLSPLSREEILFLHNEDRVSLPDLVADVAIETLRGEVRPAEGWRPARESLTRLRCRCAVPRAALTTFDPGGAEV
jgi:guanylate kinase